MADKPEIDRIVPAHAALVFVLRHIAIQQPEAKAEAQKHIDNLDEQFRQLLENPPAPAAARGRTRGAAGDTGAKGPQSAQGETGAQGDPGNQQQT